MPSHLTDGTLRNKNAKLDMSASNERAMFVKVNFAEMHLLRCSGDEEQNVYLAVLSGH